MGVEPADGGGGYTGLSPSPSATVLPCHTGDFLPALCAAHLTQTLPTLSQVAPYCQNQTGKPLRWGHHLSHTKGSVSKNWPVLLQAPLYPEHIQQQQQQLNYSLLRQNHAQNLLCVKPAYRLESASCVCCDLEITVLEAPSIKSFMEEWKILFFTLRSSRTCEAAHGCAVMCEL